MAVFKVENMACDDVVTWTPKAKRKYKQRVMDPEKKPEHIILRARTTLSLKSVRDAVRFGGVEDKRLFLDWDMTACCKGCKTLKQVRKVIKARGKKNYTYIPVKMMGDGMTVVVKKMPTVDIA